MLKPLVSNVEVAPPPATLFLDLQRDLGSTMQLLWHLQHASDHEAHDIFARIRNGQDPSTIIASLAQLDLEPESSKRAEASSEDNMKSRTTLVEALGR